MAMRLLIASTLLTSAVAAVQAATVSELDWLAGCWASETGERGSGEHWTAPAGGTVLGMSRTVRDGRTVAHEFLRIATADGGSLTLTAQPSGQAQAVFELERLGDREVAFANPRHDFPQRIVYRLDAGGVLRASIEGPRDGETVVVDFPMRRTACGGQ